MSDLAAVVATASYFRDFPAPVLLSVSKVETPQTRSQSVKKSAIQLKLAPYLHYIMAFKHLCFIDKQRLRGND